jgi:type II secretory pathway component GspD/PulD (secretin)
MYRYKNLSAIIRMKKGLFVCGFLLALMAVIVVGDVEQGTMMARADDGIDAVDADVSRSKNTPDQDESIAQMAQGASADNTIQSINFKKDVEIKDALRFLAAKYRKNIVPSSKVDGLITISSLYDVTFEEALEAILGHGFEYEQQGNFIKIYTAEEYKDIKEDTGRMVHKVFTLYYITAAEAKKLIAPVLSDSGEVESTTAAETGVPVSESITADTGGGDSTAAHDTIVVYDYPENIVKVEEIITSVDVRPKQVLIEATILSATLTEDMQFGIDWQTLNETFTQLSNITRHSSDYYKFAATSMVTKTGGMTIGFPYDNVAVFIKAVETVTDVTVLANPKILAVNKQLGQVYIGKKLGYNSQTTQTDTSTTSQVEFLDTGTKLSFRPYIGNDGYIRMDIHPKDSSGTLKANDIPDEESAELVTNIIVKDGQTIVIGGLFRDKITTTKTQIPVIGDLPIIGAAFRGTTDKSERQEVIVLITPHIVKEPAQLDGKARAADVSRKRYGARMSLQWTNRTRLAEDNYASAVKYYSQGNKKAALDKLNWALGTRPTYLEALRLKERIIREANPDNTRTIERIMLGIIEQEESSKWQRR